MSCHALIFRRRQTQQRCSEAASVTSAPQTVHLVTLFALSGEMDRLACSRISGETIGAADLTGGLRLIELPYYRKKASQPQYGSYLQLCGTRIMLPRRLASRGRRPM